MESAEIKAPSCFNGENYTSWAFKFEQWMQWKDLWHVFTTDPPSGGVDDDDDEKAKWRRQNAQGYSALTLSVGEDELAAIKEFKDKNNWKVWKSKHHLALMVKITHPGPLNLSSGWN